MCHVARKKLKRDKTWIIVQKKKCCEMNAVILQLCFLYLFEIAEKLQLFVQFQYLKPKLFGHFESKQTTSSQGFEAIASPKERPQEEYVTFTVRGQSLMAPFSCFFFVLHGKSN